MDEQPPIIECVFCGASLTPELAALFLETANREEQDPDADVPQPICTECQAGIDENQRHREADLAHDQALRIPIVLKVLFLLFFVATACVIVEAALKSLFGPVRR